MKGKDMKLNDLKKEIPCKWRVQSFSQYKPQGQCVAYIDARDAMDLLDEVCGASNWQDDYKVVDEKLFAGVGIYTDDKGLSNSWIWKWDTGVESNIEKEKGQSSDAFKRACVKWGIGRFLYHKKTQFVDANEIKKKQPVNFPHPVDSSGKRIWDLTKHINDTLVKPKPQKIKEIVHVAKKKSYKNFDFLKEMKIIKERLNKVTGDDKKYRYILGQAGYTKSNEIPPEKQVAALKFFNDLTADQEKIAKGEA